MFRLLSTIFFICFITNSIAQDAVLYLKNGSIIKGEIINYQHPDTVYLSTYYGSKFSVNRKEIKKVVSDDFDGSLNKIEHNIPTKKGYKGNISAGYSFDLGTAEENYFLITTTHGYLINPYFFVGAGAGFFRKYNLKETLIPIYFDTQVNFTQTKCIPFMELQLGCINPMSFAYVPRIYTSAGMGMKYALTERNRMLLGLHYTFYKEDGFFSNGVEERKIKKERSALSLNLAFEF